MGLVFVGLIVLDYERYAVIWSCESILGFDVEVMWILSRTPVLDEDLYNQLVEEWGPKLDYNTKNLVKTVQKGCEYP